MLHEHQRDCLRAVGRGTPSIHRPTACGQWAVQLVQCAATLPAGSGQCKSCFAPPHCLIYIGQWNSCNSPPHFVWAVDNGIPAMHHHTAWGYWAWNSWSLPPHRLGAVGGGTPAMYRNTACGQWAVEFLQCNTTMPMGSGHSCDAPPHSLRAAGSGTPAMHRHTALQLTATPPLGRGQWKSCSLPPH